MEEFAKGAITLTSGDGIASVTLNRPAVRNAMSQSMWRALPDIANRLQTDTSIRAVVLTGAGGHFCGGADIAEFESVFADATAARAYNDLVHRAQEAWTRLPRPTIAMIKGVAVGAGCGLAMACDLRFAAENAKLAMPPAKLGANYPFAGTKTLVDLVGPARAKDMLYSGRLVTAEEALRIGLIDRALPPAAMAAATKDYANELADLSASSHRVTKEIVQAICDGCDQETPALQALFDGSFAGQDFREGYQAFLEKRKPRFR